MQQPYIKNFFKFIVVAFIVLVKQTSFSQVLGTPPEGINYQAIARDTSGFPLSNASNLNITFTIFDSITGGTALFTENHPNVSTNRFGLFTLVIGSQNTSDFATIHWESGSKFIEVGIDSGSTGAVTLPRTQLVSVPFAFHAKMANSSLISLGNWSLFGNTANTNHFIGTLNNSPLLFKTSNVSRMIIDNNGNVGIGTSTPSSPLTIQTVSGNDLEFSSSANADIYANAQLNMGSSTFLNFSTAGASRIVVDNTGNVGIGTPSPTSKLEIAGQIKITGGSPGLNKVLTSDAAGLASWTTPTFPYSFGTGLSLNGTTINSVWTQLGNNIYNNNSDNVGINTSNPHSELEIVHNSNSIPHGIAVTTYENSAVGDAHLWLKKARGTEGSPTVILNGDEIGFLKFRGYDGSSGGFNTNDETEIGAIAAENFSSSSNGSHLIFMTTPIGTTNGIERMRISQNGNVGIATTTPSSTLDVNGTVTISGTNSNELNRTQTGAANLAPIAYGNIDNNAGINNGTPNFTVIWDNINFYYKIHITSESYNVDNYITLVTPIGNNVKTATNDDGNGNLVVIIYNSAGIQIKNQFQFVIYKP